MSGPAERLSLGVIQARAPDRDDAPRFLPKLYAFHHS